VEEELQAVREEGFELMGSDYDVLEKEDEKEEKRLRAVRKEGGEEGGREGEREDDPAKIALFPVDNSSFLPPSLPPFRPSFFPPSLDSAKTFR